MFGKKKKAAVEDGEEVRLRSGDALFFSHPMKKYIPFAKFSDAVFARELEKHLVKFFAGNVDVGNSDMLDQFILDSVGRAFADLTKQRAAHLVSIKKRAIRNETDAANLRAILGEEERKLAVYQTMAEELHNKYPRY